MNLKDNFMSEKEFFSSGTSETPPEAEFDELCQTCGAPTGKKIAVGDSHGWCAKCLVDYRQEYEDAREHFAEIRRRTEAREAENKQE